MLYNGEIQATDREVIFSVDNLSLERRIDSATYHAPINLISYRRAPEESWPKMISRSLCSTFQILKIKRSTTNPRVPSRSRIDWPLDPVFITTYISIENTSMLFDEMVVRCFSILEFKLTETDPADVGSALAGDATASSVLLDWGFAVGAI